LLNAPEWKQAVFGCLNAMVFGAIQPVYAYAMGSLIFIYFDTDYEEIKNKTKVYSLCFLGLFVITLVVNVGQHYNFAYMGEYLTKRVRESMLSKIITFEVAWFDRDENSSGAICSRLANDANVVRFYFPFDSVACINNDLFIFFIRNKHKGIYFGAVNNFSLLCSYS
jgi:ATP-binding cassette subfamily B (MDR/TAP) protein 1